MATNNDVDRLCARYLEGMEEVSLTPEEVKALPNNISRYWRIWKSIPKKYIFDPAMFSKWRKGITLHQPGLGQPYELLDGLGRVQSGIQYENTELLKFRVVRGACETKLLRIAALLHCGDENVENQGLHLANAFKDDPGVGLELKTKMAGLDLNHMRKLEKVAELGLYASVLSGRLSRTDAYKLITRKRKSTLADFLAGKSTPAQVRRALRTR